MPWRECSKMDERLRFVARLLEGEKMAELCREFDISRGSISRWASRSERRSKGPDFHLPDTGLGAGRQTPDCLASIRFAHRAITSPNTLSPPPTAKRQGDSGDEGRHAARLPCMAMRFARCETTSSRTHRDSYHRPGVCGYPFLRGCSGWFKSLVTATSS